MNGFHCCVCGCEHEAIEAFGVTLIGCPKVPMNMFLPYYPPKPVAERPWIDPTPLENALLTLRDVRKMLETNDRDHDAIASWVEYAERQIRSAMREVENG